MEVLSRLISKKLESFEMEVQEKESTKKRMPLSGVVKMTFASSTGRIALEDEVCFVGEGAFKRVMVCKKYPLALKFTFKVGASKQGWPHHCLKEPEVFDQASTCHDLMVAYFGGVFLDGDWSRTLRGSARTPATDVGSVTIAERACEVSETVARQQWMQACTSTLLRLHLKMQLGLARTVLESFLRGFTPWDAKLDNFGTRLSEAWAIGAQAERRADFSEASSLGSVCPDDRWVLIDIDPFQKSSIHHANQPEGSNLCKVMLRSVTHLSALLDPRSSYAAHVDQSWRAPLQEVVQIFSAVFSNESELKWTTKLSQQQALAVMRELQTRFDALVAAYRPSPSSAPSRPPATVEAPTAPRPPRRMNTWGETFCQKLLARSPLLAVKLRVQETVMRGLAQVEQCPKPNRLRVKWLAAPLEFLSFCSEVQDSNDLFCQDHAQEDAAPTAAAIHAREVCHVEGKLAVSVWVSLADAAWPATCQHYVQSYCARTCLATWSTKEMDESLGRLQEEFTVRPDQAGFFQSPSERLQPEAVTREQREIDGALPYQARKSDERKRKVRRGYEDVPPFVLKVVQDMLRTLHNLLPLDRLCWSAQENELASTQAGANPMWQKGYDGAFKFAGGRRGMKLCELMRADWFRSEPDCYGLRSEFIIDVFLAMLAWMRPHFCQLGQHSTTEERQNHFSHQLRFYGVQLSDAEMESLAGAVVAATSVRWMWVSSYIALRRLADPASAASR